MIKFLICFLLISISIISCKDNESNTILLETFDKSAKNNISVLNKSKSKLNHMNSLIDYNKIDVDLTALSDTMVYAEVFNMIMNPENYEDKIVKMKGQFVVFEDMENGNPFYACVIPDATACCLQGFEFVPLSEYDYPNNYPEIDSEITIIGKFEYDENNFGYCRLINAKFVR